MSDKVNFADPDFEPTDEQLQQLFHEAFADVGTRHHKALASLRSEIERLRVEALAYATTLAAGDVDP